MKLENNKKNIFLLTVVFVYFLLLNYLFSLTSADYAYDAQAYWEIGKSYFSKNGTFSLFNIIDGFRGYIFPLFLALCYKLDSIIGFECSYKIVSSIIFTCFFVCIYPSLLRKIGFKFSKVYQIIIPIILTSIFFYGILIYPLSDMFALISFMLAVLLGLEVQENESNIGIRLIKSLLCGVFIYFAYNIRTIYLFGAIVFLIYWIVTSRKQSVFMLLPIIVMGGGLSSIPQLMINIHLYNIPSIMVQTNGLFAQQLFWGLQYTRYGTYIGGDVSIGPGIYFKDMTGWQIYNEHINNSGGITISGYLQCIANYPLEVLGIYFRHLFSALFIAFPEVYTDHLKNNRYFILLFNFLILYISLVYCRYNFYNHVFNLKLFKKNIKTVCLIILLCIPGLFITLGALEERFLVLFYLLLYAYFSHINYRNLLEYLRNNLYAVLFMGLLLLGFYTATSGSILAGLDGYILLFK